MTIVITARNFVRIRFDDVALSRLAGPGVPPSFTHDAEEFAFTSLPLSLPRA